MAWAHATNSTTATESFDLAFDEGTQRFSRTVRASGAGTMLGWALSAGFDWKKPIDPGSSLVLDLEYLHYEFPKNTISDSATTLRDQTGAIVGFLFVVRHHLNDD
jgi:hypothetical protein